MTLSPLDESEVQFSVSPLWEGGLSLWDVVLEFRSVFGLPRRWSALPLGCKGVVLWNVVRWNKDVVLGDENVVLKA